VRITSWSNRIKKSDEVGFLIRKANGPIAQVESL
jgi:hypothetical protein